MQEQRKMLEMMLEREAKGKPELENYIKAIIEVIDLGDQIGIADLAITILENFLLGTSESKDNFMTAYRMLKRSIELMSGQ